MGMLNRKAEIFGFTFGWYKAVVGEKQVI